MKNLKLIIIAISLILLTNCGFKIIDKRELLNFNIDVIAIALAALGFISIIGSIFIWNIKKGETAEGLALFLTERLALARKRAHAERFGIFIGLWAPTFFALAVLAMVI